jgi:lipoate-protein ligase A
MQQLILTLSDTPGNLALDEWLLQRSDSGSTPREVLRVWENPCPAVILGRSSRVSHEVRRDACQRLGIKWFRRSSGGAAVMIGPGCLMYSAVLDYRLRPELKMLDRAHQFVMQKLRSAITRCGVTVQYQGTCDLTLQGRKFSGNSLRCQRHSFLYHGTLLYDFDLQLLHDCLGTPPRQPAYREGRVHRDFVTNLPVERQRLSTALIEEWQAEQVCPDPDVAAIEQLANGKYRDPAWTGKR